MTREKAIDLLEGIVKGTDENPLYDAIRMAVDALERPREMLTCEGCKYNHFWRYQDICYKCMRAACDNYEAEGEE